MSRNSEHEEQLFKLLQAREYRVYRQNQMIAQFGKPIMSVRVNTPGLQKNTDLAYQIFEQSIKAIEVCIGKKKEYVWYCESGEGPTAIYSVDMDANDLKKRAIDLEERFPLGRFLDLDVHGVDGKAWSRRDLNLPARLCYLCSDPAVLCGRSQKHEVQALIDKMQSTYESYMR